MAVSVDRSIVKDLDLASAGLNLGNPRRRSHCSPMATTSFWMVTRSVALASTPQTKRPTEISRAWCAVSPS
ncbi:MAG: hypothetical protein CM15mP74_35940 [Halieaceae bacterium]|nr:MAG: hypothetical protein CM15mP74_35940 [Halieaceae bacterium]